MYYGTMVLWYTIEGRYFIIMVYECIILHVHFSYAFKHNSYTFNCLLIILLLNRVLQVTNLNGLPHSLLSYGHLIPGERACTGRSCLIKKFFQGLSKGRYIPWVVPEDSGYWLNGVLRGWSANG